MSEILETMDYSIFRDITSNREVDSIHVRKLATSIKRKNLLSLHPILVNSNMEIIDGQHRLEAAKYLQIPIYYIISDGIGKIDISVINSNQKKWSINDYINYFTIEKVAEFEVLSKFINQHSWIKSTTALQLLSSSGKYSREGLQSGEIEVDNLELANDIATLAEKIRCVYLGFDFVFTSGFIKALRICFKNENFKPNQLIDQLKEQPRTLVKCVSTDQYIELIEQIYNYHKKYKINLR